MNRCVWCFVVGVVLWALSVPAWAITVTINGYYVSTAVRCPASGIAGKLGRSQGPTVVPSDCTYWSGNPAGREVVHTTWAASPNGHCPTGSLSTVTVSSYSATNTTVRVVVDAYGCQTLIPQSCQPGEVNDGGVCHAACVAPAVWNPATYLCEAPTCPSGTQFLGFGGSTGPQCLDGCSYAAGSETRYTTNFGVPGVLSRWTSSGATCTGGDTLTAADTSGCPNEVSVDLKPILCGLPSPCAQGEILFLGQCVVDTPETGCVIVDGEQVCAEAAQNCVVIDGNRVCAEVPEGPEDLETYKENGCVWSFAQGAWVCPTQAATTTSTSTTDRTTDPVTGNTTEVTTNTTTNNTTGATTTTTTTTIYNSQGQQISQTKQEKVDKPAQAAGVLAVRGPKALGEKPDLDWLRTAQEVKDNLSAQWEAVPLVAAVSSFSNLQLNGVTPACPEFCLPFWGETLCTTKHCEIWATISFIISGVLLALYGMTAIRIVLSA